MDDTQKYIKMSKMAWEIQKDWKPQEGDFITMPEGIRPIGSDLIFNGKHPELPILKFYIQEEMKFDYVREPKYSDTLTIRTGEYIFKKFRNVTCLFRQDQLQEKYNSISKGYGLARVFAEWLVQDDTRMYIAEQGFNSQEQLWLAFLMKTKYQKQWNALQGKWISK